jgi:hypothetical protein
MKRFAIIAATGALAIPALAQADDSYNLPPSNAASAACKAELAQMGSATFKATYGTNRTRSNAFGKCVSKHTKTEKANQSNGAASCRAEQSDANFAASHGGKTFDQFYGTGKNGKNAFGKCVSTKAKAASDKQVKSDVGAAQSCTKQRKGSPKAFKGKYGNSRTAFGKCVSALAKSKGQSS